MYTYADSLMRGFRQTHQPSPWMNDYGTFSIMPLAGELKMSHKERLVPFSHQQEKATPYNYSVTFDNGLQTSLSATSRGAVFEVSFPEKEDQYVVVDAYHGGSSITIEPENRLVKGATRYNNGGVRIRRTGWQYLKKRGETMSSGLPQESSLRCIPRGRFSALSAWRSAASWQIGRASCRERVCLYV